VNGEWGVKQILSVDYYFYFKEIKDFKAGLENLKEFRKIVKS
jgi:hypothetical protein